MSSMSDLEKDIEASRARLDEKIDRIQDRLSAGSLVDEMLGSARRTPQLDGLYDSALDAVRRNPVPVLLIAAGVGLLLRGMSGSGRRTIPGRGLSPVSTDADRLDRSQPTGERIEDVAGGAKP